MQDLLQIVNFDNFISIFPNFVGSAFTEDIGNVQVIDIPLQTPPIQFRNQGLSSSFIGNLSPLLLIYLVSFFLVFLLSRV